MKCPRHSQRGYCAMYRRASALLASGAVAFACAFAYAFAWMTASPTVAHAQRSAPARGPAVPTAALVFDGVTVVDVAQGKLLPAQRVVVEGNRVQAVGDIGAVKTPPGAQVVDARGKFLIPGLWDMHIHPLANAPDFYYPLLIANGVTGIRDAWSTEPLENQLQWWHEILAGTRVGPPRQLLSGDPLSEEDSAEAQNHVDSLKAAGANFIKTYPFQFALAAAARRAGLQWGGHGRGGTAIEMSDSGASIIDHVNGSALHPSCLGATTDVTACQEIADHFRRNGTWWVPTLGLLGGGLIGGMEDVHLGEASHAAYNRFHEVIAQFWKGTNPEQGWLHGTTKTAVSDSIPLLSVMQRVGLPILAGTDTFHDPQEYTPGFSLHMELAIYVNEGMTPLEALRAATINPAKMLHATDSLGTVAPGKLADLVLLDADPLADITNTTTIRAVVANGRYFDRAALDGVLAEVRGKAPQAP